MNHLSSERADRISYLAARNVTFKDIDGSLQRTSVRLEQCFWTALADAAKSLECSRRELVSMIHKHRRDDLGMTSALRIFVLVWWRVLPAIGINAALASALAAVAKPSEGGLVQPLAAVTGRVIRR